MVGFFTLLITNRLFITVIAAAMIAQIAKIIVASVKHGKFDISMMGGTGGMPSSHTAVVISLVSGIYYTEGVSGLSVAAGVFATIIIYDALTWRRTVGFQSEVLNNLIKKLHVEHQKKLKELLGHNVPEVAIGAILGYVIAFVVYHI